MDAEDELETLSPPRNNENSSGFAARLEALKQKSAKIRQQNLEKLRERTIQIKNQAIEATARVSAKVSAKAKDATKRMSVKTAMEISRLSRRMSSRLSIKSGRDRTNSITSPFLQPEGKFDEETESAKSSSAEEKEDEKDHIEQMVEIPQLEIVEPVILEQIPEDEKLPMVPMLRPVKEEKFDTKHVTWTRLHNALIDKKWAEAAWLVNQNVDIKSWKGILGESTLHEAIMRRAPSNVIKAFVNRGGIDVNMKTKLGLTPLHCACMYNPSAAVIEILIKAGSEVNAKTKKEMTPLSSATAQGRSAEILLLLLKLGANINLRNSEGKTAIDLAREKNLPTKQVLEGYSAIHALICSKPPVFPIPVLRRLKNFMY